MRDVFFPLKSLLITLLPELPLFSPREKKKDQNKQQTPSNETKTQIESPTFL